MKVLILFLTMATVFWLGAAACYVLAIPFLQRKAYYAARRRFIVRLGELQRQRDTLEAALNCRANEWPVVLDAEEV